MIKMKRRLLKIGYSRAITLPPAWVAIHGEENEKVTVLGQDILIIAPAGLEQRAEQMFLDMECYREAVTGNTKQEAIES